MPINLQGPVDTLTTPVLVGDSIKVTGGSNDALPTLTKVNGQPIAAAFEVQSTGGAFVLPRMTTVQKNALTPVTDGMQVFDTDLGTVSAYANTLWSTGAFLEATYALTAANILAMNGAAVTVVPAVVNKIILVEKWAITFTGGTVTFTGGGQVYLQYGNGVAGTNAASNTLANLLTAGNGVKNYGMSGGQTGTGAAVTYASVVGQPVAITNSTGAFGGGGNGTGVVKVWYRLVNSF